MKQNVFFVAQDQYVSASADAPIVLLTTVSSIKSSEQEYLDYT